MTLLIARGTLDDVTETDALIRATAEWLIKKGEPLWGPNETSLTNSCAWHGWAS